ncbi:unnamed protein product [Ectocarpus sp. 6 AP-2014]
MRVWRGGGTAGGTPPTASKGEPKKSDEPSVPPRSTGDGVEGGNTVRAGTMESASLLAGNVQRLHFLRKKTGVDLAVTVYSLYAMAIRSVISTIGQPLRDATARRTRLFGAASDEAAAAGAAAASGEAASASMLDGFEGVVGAGGAAAEALAREALEPMPFAYLPSVGAMLLLVAAVAAHVLLLLGKKWSVRFHAWSAFDEVLTWEEADAVLVTPVRHTGSPAICPLVGTPRLLRDPTATEEGQESEDESQDAEDEEKARRKFVLKRAVTDAARGSESKRDDEEKEELEKEEGEGEGEGSARRGAGDEVADTFELVELPIRWPLGRYLQAGGLTLEDAAAKLTLFGENSVDVKQPTFWHHLADRLTSPFVVFNLFNQVLWMLELYWLKALLAIGEVIGVEAIFVADAERRRMQLDIRNSKKPTKRVRAWRGGQWVPIPVSSMLPGDLVSLKTGVVAVAPEGSEVGDGQDDTKMQDEEAFFVGELPADVLLLRGTAVVNEASLTGESVPQIKTSLMSEPIDFEDELDMTGRHSGHVLLSGTTLLDQTDGSDSDSSRPSPTETSSATFGSSSLPASTPDGGALCYVLRTGVYSFQGDLRRTIDFGNHGVRQESKDAGYLLAFLLTFAALSSAHVVREGLKSQAVSGFRLLVQQCVRIFSAVVPGDLSFELNQCLRNGVRSLQNGHALACAEPFRIPLAGKVDVCLFDKTGTITSDKLRAETPKSLRPNSPPVAVSLGHSARSGGTAAGSERPGLAAEVVVGGCHSLMDVDGVLHGDPLEASALEGIRWKWDAVSHTARPDDGEPAVALHSDGDGGKGGCANDDDDSDKSTGGNSRKPEGKPGAKVEKKKGGRRKTKARGASGNTGSHERGVEKTSGDGVSVGVWRRYAFSSQLQRMSVVAEVCGGSADLTDKEGVPEAWVLSKGSPESMKPLLDDEVLPDWYEEEYDRLARSGRRVVALAHRSLGPSTSKGAKAALASLSRAEAEKEGSLVFDGFLSFHCKTRADSKRVIRDLRHAGGCSVTIVTGDSVMTACHVAGEVGLVGEIEPAAGSSEPSPSASSTASAKKKVGGKEVKTTNAEGGGEEDEAGRRSDEKQKTPLLLTVVPTDNGDELRWAPLHPRAPDTDQAREAETQNSLEEPATDAEKAAAGDRDEVIEFSWGGMEGLAATHDLCATGPAFALALGEEDPAMGSALHHFRVLARMTPGLKEKLATLLMEAGKTVLMCGDGSNDVGALRRSHVGLALLSGFGDANTDESKSESPSVTSDGGATTKNKGKDETVKSGGGGGAQAGALEGKNAAEILKEEREKVQADITEEFDRLRSEGVNPAKAMWKASSAANKKRSMRDIQQKKASHGDFAASAVAMFKDTDTDEQEGADGVVKTGDASLAAPFTSKKPSIVAVVDAVRQGRCTLAAVLHTYQMVALHALFSSYTSSVLYLMKVRWPQRPLVVSSLMFAPLSVALACPATPEDMSPIRPPSSVFHKSTFLSLLGQAGIHVGSMAFAVWAAKAHSSSESLPVAEVKGLLGPKFVPNLVSNAVFLLATIQSISVSIVNFKGRPFMSGILENSAIFLPAVSIVAFCFALVLEIVPPMNTVGDCVQLTCSCFVRAFAICLERALGRTGTCGYELWLGLLYSTTLCWASEASDVDGHALHLPRFHANNQNLNEPQVLELKPFPSIAAKLSILGSMLVSLLAPLAVDRLCVKLFDPELHKARKAGPPLGMVEKRNLALLGALLLVVAVTVSGMDFEVLEEAFEAL